MTATFASEFEVGVGDEDPRILKFGGQLLRL
uniref:Methylcobalamin:com methyltransferase n=1 Tax=Rhizophora mucronata TaxID=61149 RepID=A0A2P2K229_RHIMU